MADTFEQQMAKFREKVEERSSQVCRKVGLELHNIIVRKTPVDTGRLKANNQLGIKQNNLSLVDSLDKTKLGSAAKETLWAAVESSKSFKIGDDIIIFNNVEYAEAIEKGHSKAQAPRGFFIVSVGDIVAKWPNIVQEVKSAT